MLFGRAQEEIDALHRAGVAVEIVPGVSAALSASADVGQSLTERGVSRSVTLLTPRVGTGEVNMIGRCLPPLPTRLRCIWRVARRQSFLKA